jgi:hypothetical protein
MQGKFYSIKRLTDDMLEWMIEMHKSYPNVTKKVTKITGLAQTIRTWLSPEYPIHHFIEIRKKSKRYNEYRIRPELSQLLWRDVVCLKKKANTDKLKKLCRANDWLNEIVNPPEKLTTKSPKKEQSVPLTESPKKEQSVPLEESNLKTKSSNQEPSDQTSDIPDVLKKVVEVLKGNNLQDIFDNGIDIHISFGNSKSNNLDSKIDDVNARLDAIAAEVAAIAKVWK